MELFQIINYNSNPAIKIEREHLNELKKGKYCEFAEYLKLAPEKENLIIEMLPEEILLYIFQYLSPGDLIRIALTCTTLNELSQDKNTWRIVSYNYNKFFLLNKVEFEKRIYFYQENQIPIYGIIEETELSNDNIDSKKLKKTKSKLSSFFKRRNENQNENENELENLFDQNETKEKLIEYIEKVPNPKEELISKANLIYNGIKERKEQVEENLNRRNEDDKKWRKTGRTENFLFRNLILLAIGFVAFIITLNIYIEKKLPSNILYVFIPILLPIFIFIILFFLLSKFEKDFRISIFGFIMTILFIQLFLIGLRSDSTIKGSWLVIFIPFFILVAIITTQIIIIFKKKGFDQEFTTPLMVLIMTFLFLLFLGLRLDDKIKWNYGIVFIPLFIINTFPFWIFFSSSVLVLPIVLFIIVSIPFLLFEIFLGLFLEGNSKFNYISYAFFPIYIDLMLILCYSMNFDVKNLLN